MLAHDHEIAVVADLVSDELLHHVAVVHQRGIASWFEPDGFCELVQPAQMPVGGGDAMHLDQILAEVGEVQQPVERRMVDVQQHQIGVGRDCAHGGEFEGRCRLEVDRDQGPQVELLAPFANDEGGARARCCNARP